jgi:hypothetical protein
LIFQYPCQKAICPPREQCKRNVSHFSKISNKQQFQPPILKESLFYVSDNKDRYIKGFFNEILNHFLTHLAGLFADGVLVDAKFQGYKTLKILTAKNNVIAK